MKILLIQLKRAGDVILTTPVAALIKRKWPDAQVDFLTDRAFAPLLENNPSVDKLWIYDRDHPWLTIFSLRARGYDQIFDFQGSPRSAVAAGLSRAAKTAGYRMSFWGHFYGQTIRRPGDSVSVTQGKVSLIEAVFGTLGKPAGPQIVLRDEEREWAKQAMTESSGKSIVGLVPTSRQISRRWPVDSFAALARRFEKAGQAVWLFWGPGEREYAEGLQRQVPASRMIPPTSLRQMAALLARCSLVMGNTNGPLHMAAAVGVPTVTVHGPTDAVAWHPGGEQHKMVQAVGLGCLGCNMNICPFGHECMTQVSPEQVWAACLSVTPAVVSRGPAETL